ncbi:MAG: hypothetical protein HUU38_04915, partial [Anaerolineales bacterium]|nr:hypothetical protein [Anaerolineales bacterium]
PTPTPTPTNTGTGTPTPTPTNTGTSTPTPTSTGTNTPTNTRTHTPTNTPTNTPTPTPTNTPTRIPPTPTPSGETKNIFYTRGSGGNGQMVSYIVDGGSSAFGLGAMGADPSGVALDDVNDKLYWGDRTANTIMRSNLDGSGQEMVTNFTDPRGLALDVAGQILYLSSASQIYTYDLQNTTLTLLVNEGGPLALDAERGHLYWAHNNGGTSTIKWVDITAPAVQTSVVTGIVGIANGVTVDGPNEFVYWTEATSHEIRRADLLGQNLVTISTGTAGSCGDDGTPLRLTVDVAGGYVYWTQLTGLYRAALAPNSSAQGILGSNGCTALSLGGGIVLGFVPAPPTATPTNTPTATQTPTNIPTPTATATPIAGALIVDTLGDGTPAPCDGNNHCATLRDAIETANNSAGTTTIVFAGGLNGTLTLTEGELTLSSNVVLQGPGASTLTVSAGSLSRVFNVLSGNVTLSGVAITDGFGTVGGGIQNTGNLLLSNVAVFNNTGDVGGGIASSGILTLTASAVYANTAFNGGGIDVDFGTATLINSTISGNTASNTGGGLMVAGGGTVHLNNMTIANNAATGGGEVPTEGGTGGVQLSSGAVNVQNSLIAGNTSAGSGSAFNADCNTPLTSLGYNLTGDGTGCSLSGTGDLTVLPGDVFVIVLGSLQDNGGSTWTHALLAGSPALDVANTSACEATDQRGISRPQGTACDIGAFERETGVVVWFSNLWGQVVSFFSSDAQESAKPLLQTDSVHTRTKVNGKGEFPPSRGETAPLNLNYASPVMELPWSLAPIMDDPEPDYIPALDTAILTPTYGALFNTLDPISISGNAHADNSLKRLSLLLNDVEIYSADYLAEDQLTDVAWSTVFTPTADGRFILVALAEDWAGNVQTVARPIEIFIATTAPTISLETDAVAGPENLAIPAVMTGTTNVPGNALIEVQPGAGEPFLPATLNQGTWAFSWNVDAAMDGVSVPVTVRLTDSLNRTVTTTQNIVVDVVVPQAVEITAQYRDPNNALFPLLPGDTVRETDPTLVLDWTASTDGSGIAEYLVGFTTSADPDANALTSLGNGTLHFEFTPAEAQTYFAHLITRDGLGNETVQTVGPFFVDAPTTPDLVTPLTSLDWTESGATLIASDGALHRLNEAHPIQRFYTSWNTDTLRMAWTGASWNGDGDLFFYLDTGAGGATSLYNPYPTGPVVSLPDAFGADYLLWLEDGTTAQLYQWNGSWTLTQTLTADHLRADATRTDVILPFAWVGLAPGAALNLLAVATDEDALQLWATAPGKNPLNSPRLQPAQDFGDFQLTQFYAIPALSDGVRPDGGKVVGGDVQASLTSSAGSITTGYLNEGLFDLLTPNARLDADNDGVPDTALPFALNLVTLGNGTIAYTLHYQNLGDQVAENVQVTAQAFGALRFSNGSDTATFSLGDVGVGISNTLQIDGLINPALNGSAELLLTLSDEEHGAFDWLWALNPVDNGAPQGLTIATNGNSAQAGVRTFSGLVSDPAGVTLVTLDVDGQLINCPVAEPFAGSWSCPVDLGNPATTTQIEVRARAQDSYGTLSPWTEPVTLTIDVTAPNVTLESTVQGYLQDGWLGPAEMLWAGTLVDDLTAASVSLCTTPDLEPACALAPALPGDNPAGVWTYDLSGMLAGDGISTTLSLYGADGVGNLSASPLRFTVMVDTIRPTLSLDSVIPSVIYPNSPVNLNGAVGDGGGVSQMNALLLAPDGSGNAETVTFNGQQWSHTFTLNQIGIYILHLEARDLAGNVTVIGPFFLEVTEPPTPTPTNTPTATNTPTPTNTPTATPTSTPTPSNQPPTIAVAAGGSCTVDLAYSSATMPLGGVMNLTVFDADGDLLTLTGTSSNPSLIPNSNILFGGSGANRTVTLIILPPTVMSQATITITVSDGAATATITLEVVAGTAGSDRRLVGTSGADLILGLNGNDIITSLAGNDLACGGVGNDTLTGGENEDTLYGGSGNDILNGNDGNDSLFGEVGNDKLTGGAGADFFSGGPGRDSAADFLPGEGDTQDGTIP